MLLPAHGAPGAVEDSPSPHPSGQTEDEKETQQGLEETEDLRLSTILDNSLFARPC